MKITRHLLIKGRVQGVYYRANTQKQAKQLAITGLVRNLPSGDVEAIATGTPEALDQLIAWCHKGPLLAKVNDVIVTPLNTDDGFTDFKVDD